jgi:hypothetical protein
VVRAHAERIDLFVQLEPQLLGAGLRPALPEVVDVDGGHQGLLRHHHRFFRRAADSDAQHPGRTPVAAHGRDLAQYPLHHVVARIEDGEARLALGAAPLGRQLDLDAVPRHDFHVDDGRRVVACVLALAVGIRKDRCAQRVVLVRVGAAHPFIHHFLDAQGRLPAHVHPDPEKHHGDSGVLTHRAVAFRGHAAVDEDLRDCVLRRG